MTSSSSSSFSKPNSHWIYDVFINFRGEDTRKNFVSHLHAALCNAGVNTFFDDSSLRRGYELGRELTRAIEGSQIAIVIFSKHYSESKWCLDELVKIMECSEVRAQKVFPVFYDVSPSLIRLALGKSVNESNRDLFLQYSYDEIDDLIAVPITQQWKKAMADACNLAGWDVRNYRNENDVVNEIVHKVQKNLDRTYLSLPDYAVGLDSRAQQVSSFIRQQRERVCMVGIWGMGGIGKTTVAKAIYNEIRHEFEDRSFLANIREAWESDKGKTNLQGQLLSDIIKTKKIKVHSIEWGKDMIKETLCKKRALIVLDDVNKLEQLNALCGNHNRIGPGNVIIITSRDAHLLEVFEVDYVYGVDELNESEGLELFNWHAFKEETSKKGFIELSRKVVSYCGGLPLALEVLGSYLHKRNKEQWKSALSKLEKIPNEDIQGKLKISYDGLSDDMVQHIFLDMCCFFIGKDRAYVTKILNGCGLHAGIGIPILVERTLIKFDKNNKLVMHNLLRDMGREIVRQSSPDKPENRSRLWVYEEVIEVLNEHTGTRGIEGLALKSQRVCFCTKAFENMKRLRILQLEDVKLDGDYKYLSQHLRWIYWKGFPLKHLPDNFDQRKAVVIDLKHSNLKQVWKEKPFLDKLRILNPSHSRYLTKTPKFSRLPNLERLILKNCPRLSEVHHTIGNLSSLVLINLKDCASLRNLPIETYKLKSVHTLILSGCSKIDKLEEDIVQMESLITLIADNTGINRVPFSIVRSNIGRISLCGYDGSARDVFPSLIWSWMSPTKGIVSYNQPLGVMSTSPISIDIQGNMLGDLLSVHGGLSKLRCTRVECDSEIQLSQELRTVRDLLIFENFTESLTTSQVCRTSWGSGLIGMGNYNQVLDMLSNNLSEGLTTNDSSDIFLPDDKYPYWLAYKGEGHSVHFQVPENSGCRVKGMILCVVYSSIPETMAVEYFPSVVIINYTKCTLQIYKQDTIMSFNDQDWQGIQSNLEPGDYVEILVASGHGLIVKKTGVYLIYDSSITMIMEESIGIEMEPSPNVNVHPSSRVKKEPSQKQNKNIFTRFAKKMGAGWSGLNLNKGLHNS